MEKKFPASVILKSDFPETAFNTLKAAKGMNDFLIEALKGK